PARSAPAKKVTWRRGVERSMRARVMACSGAMLSPTDLAAFDAAYRSWAGSSPAPPPPGLIELGLRLRDEADREVSTSALGSARAEAIARQISIAVALGRL